MLQLGSEEAGLAGLEPTTYGLGNRVGNKPPKASPEALPTGLPTPGRIRSIFIGSDRQKSTDQDQHMPSEAPESASEALLTIQVKASTLEWLEALRREMGLRSPEALAARLLEELSQKSGDA